MKIVQMPKEPRSLVFDVDLTLYDNRDYYRSQTTLLVERLAVHLDMSVEETTQEVRGIREDFAGKNSGRKLSLGNAFVHLGVSLDENAVWREELFQPEDYLEPDPRLQVVLGELSEAFLIAAVTNNATSIAERTLVVLGVREYFSPVIGLDVSKESKPTMLPFKMIANQHHVSFKEMISIGDRMSVDIELPVSKGIGGILVESMEDVYRLPAILRRSSV